MVTGKLKALDDLLDMLYRRTDEKVVLVSSYTATLDVLEAYCKSKRFKCLRLDGSIAQKNRQVSCRRVSADTFIPITALPSRNLWMRSTEDVNTNPLPSF
jgi:SNF2 family DNA or RNA helicase